MMGGWAGLIAAWPNAAGACAVCFGNPEAPMNQGMAWGIMTLLFVIISVLGGIVGVTVFLARRSALVSAESLEAERESTMAAVFENDDDPWAVPFAEETKPNRTWETESVSEKELEPAGK